jgi:hypothetical protein
VVSTRLRAISIGLWLFFFASLALWVPLHLNDPFAWGQVNWAVLSYLIVLSMSARAPYWRVKRLNRRLDDQPLFRLWDYTGRMPPQLLAVRVDPRRPIDVDTVWKGALQIDFASAAAGFAAAGILAGLWFATRWPWFLVSAIGAEGVLASQIFRMARMPILGLLEPTRFLTLVKPERVVRHICFRGLSEALQSEVPIQQWHPSYFELLASATDGSGEERAAASYIYAYALLHDDLDRAARYIEKQIELRPTEKPETERFIVGDALYFYTVVRPEEAEARKAWLLGEIRKIQCDFPLKAVYIQSSMLLAEGRVEEALTLARQRLERIGTQGGTAPIQGR